MFNNLCHICINLLSLLLLLIWGHHLILLLVRILLLMNHLVLSSHHWLLITLLHVRWWDLLLSHLLLLLGKWRRIVILHDHLGWASCFEKSVQLLVIQVVEVSIGTIQDKGLAWLREMELSTNSADLKKQKPKQCKSFWVTSWHRDKFVQTHDEDTISKHPTHIHFEFMSVELFPFFLTQDFFCMLFNDLFHGLLSLICSFVGSHKIVTLILVNYAWRLLKLLLLYLRWSLHLLRNLMMRILLVL